MINPGPKQAPFTLDTLLAAHQLITPGEQAICHRHTPFAVRFLIEGDSGKSFNIDVALSSIVHVYLL